MLVPQLRKLFLVATPCTSLDGSIRKMAFSDDLRGQGRLYNFLNSLR